MSPLYGAMSVCSSTLAWLEQQERERSDWEMQSHLSKLGLSIQNFLNANSLASKLTMPLEPSKEAIEFVVCCLSVVTCLGGVIINKVRKDLPNTTERFRQPIGFLLDQIEGMVDRVEDVAEAWEIPLNQELVGRLEAAIQEIDSVKTDIPDWRMTLERISD